MRVTIPGNFSHTSKVVPVGGRMDFWKDSSLGYVVSRFIDGDVEDVAVPPA